MKINNKKIRPKYPFIRSILIKLEECLGLKKNTLEKLAIREGKTSTKEKNNFIKLIFVIKTKYIISINAVNIEKYLERNINPSIKLSAFISEINENTKTTKYDKKCFLYFIFSKNDIKFNLLIIYNITKRLRAEINKI